jgi:hypothetical protein
MRDGAALTVAATPGVKKGNRQRERKLPISVREA